MNKRIVEFHTKKENTVKQFSLRGFEPRLIKLEFIIYLPKLKVLVINFQFNFIKPRYQITPIIR